MDRALMNDGCHFGNTKPPVLVCAGSCWKYLGLYSGPAHRCVDHYRPYIPLCGGTASGPLRRQRLDPEIGLARGGRGGVRFYELFFSTPYPFYLKLVGRRLVGNMRRLTVLCLVVLCLAGDKPRQRNIVAEPLQGPLQTAAVTVSQERPV